MSNGKNANAWLATVRAFVDWTCVCGKQHRVSMPATNVRVCAQCQREWHLTMTGSVRISYQESVPVRFDENGQLSLFSGTEQAAAPSVPEAHELHQEDDA